VPHGALLDRLLGNAKLVDGDALLRLLDNPKVTAAAQIDRLLGPGSKIADSAQLETLLAHADIKDARMLQELLRHPGIADGSGLEGMLANPSLSTLPGSAGFADVLGGHIILKHVGKTDPELIARLAAETNIPAASTFVDAAQGEGAVNALIRANSAKVWEWIAGGPAGQLDLAGAFSGGRCIVRGTTTPVAGTGMELYLTGSGGGAWHIITGFPVP